MICRLCDNESVNLVIDFGTHPISRFLLNSIDDTFDTYPVRLGVCNNCSLVQLLDSIPKSILYKNGFNLSSKKNQPHLGVILDLITTLPNINTSSKILEIGCNDGSFLKYLNEIGYNNLLGIDPSAKDNESFSTIPDFFDYESATNIEKQDLIIARHVLEHINELGDFGEGLRRISKPGTLLLVEVPDFNFAIKLSDFSQIWEEHLNYFTIKTLTKYLNYYGFEVVSNYTFDYSGQALLVVAKFVDHSIDNNQFDEFYPGIGVLENNWPQYQKRLKQSIECIPGYKALYGVGCRSAALLNFAGLSSHVIYLVDDDPNKIGKVFPGKIKLKIYESNVIHDSNISTCLLAVNHENEDSVVLRHCEFLGTFYSVLNLSFRILPI